MIAVNKYWLPSLLVLATSQVLHAEEATLPVWSGGAELGSIWTNGNTKTSSLNGKFNVKREGEVWVSQAKLSALGSQERSTSTNEKRTTKEKYSGQIQFDRHFTERSYAMIVGQQDRDRFSGFHYQGSVAIGLGYRVIKNEKMNLDFEAGPGYFREHLRSDAAESGQVNESGIARMAVNYDWTIREGVSFIEEFTAEIGTDNRIYRSETGLKSQINGSLATKITYNVKHVSDVPVGKEKTDTEFGVTLVYSF